MSQEESAVATRSRCTVLTCCWMLAGASALGTTVNAEELRSPPSGYDERYETALQALITERYRAAYLRFAALADDGHVPSALMSLALIRYRPTALDGEWSATPAQLQRWGALTGEERVPLSLLAAEDGHRE